MRLEIAMLNLSKAFVKLANTPARDARERAQINKALEKQIFETMMGLHDNYQDQLNKVEGMLAEARSIANEAMEKLHAKVN